MMVEALAYRKVAETGGSTRIQGRSRGGGVKGVNTPHHPKSKLKKCNTYLTKLTFYILKIIIFYINNM